MEYFEVKMPTGDGQCGDDYCPCGFPGEAIPRGTGYLYITQDVVDFRKDARSIKEVEIKIKLIRQRLEANVVFAPGTVAPILLCEQGAKKRGVDLEIAVTDAKLSWETNKAPLRATPLAGQRSQPGQREKSQPSSREEPLCVNNVETPPL